MSLNEFKIRVETGGDRLDAFLCNRFSELTRKIVREGIEKGDIKVNGFKAKPGQMLALGDVISGSVEQRVMSARPEIGKQILPLDIVFEDEYLIAVNKPRELHCVTLLENDPPTLADALCAYNAAFLNVSIDKREAGLVQRLDFYTSGLALAAKFPEVWERLHNAFSDGKILKTYLALVEGAFPDKEQTIRSGFLSKGEKVSVVEKNKASKKGLSLKTSVCRKEKRINLSGKEFSLVQVTTTGAYRHQVRAHLAYLGFPLAGDELYGSKASLRDLKIKPTNGFLLHAESIKFDHPVTRGKLDLTCLCNVVENI